MTNKKTLVVVGVMVAVAFIAFAGTIMHKQSTHSKLINHFETAGESVFKIYQSAGTYSQDSYININSENYRLDCSGYLMAVLDEAGISNLDRNITSIELLQNKDLRDDLKKCGFVYGTINAEKLTKPAILVKQGNVAIAFPNNEYDEITYYCWGSAHSSVLSLTADELAAKHFTNAYVLN